MGWVGGTLCVWVIDDQCWLVTLTPTLTLALTLTLTLTLAPTPNPNPKREVFGGAGARPCRGAGHAACTPRVASETPASVSEGWLA